MTDLPDFLQGGKIGIPGHLPLSERNLPVSCRLYAEVAPGTVGIDHSVCGRRGSGKEIDAVLGMSVHDAAAENFDSVNGIDAGNHAQVRRIQVDAESFRTDILNERPQDLRFFRTGFNGKDNSFSRSIPRGMTDGFQHQRINRIVLIFGNHSDVGCNDMRPDPDGEISHPAEKFSALHILPARLKCMSSDIAANRGNRQTVSGAALPDLLDFFVGKSKKFPVHADLDPLKAHFPIDGECLKQRTSQRTRKSSDLHTGYSLLVFVG